MWGHPVTLSEHGVIKLGHFENIVRPMAQARRREERGQREIVFEEVIGCCDKLCVNR